MLLIWYIYINYLNLESRIIIIGEREGTSYWIATIWCIWTWLPAIFFHHTWQTFLPRYKSLKQKRFPLLLREKLLELTAAVFPALKVQSVLRTRWVGKLANVGFWSRTVAIDVFLSFTFDVVIFSFHQLIFFPNKRNVVRIVILNRWMFFVNKLW